MADPIDFPITQSRLLYAYSIDDSLHRGLLKVGEVFVNNAIADNSDKTFLAKAVRKVLDQRSYLHGVIYHIEYVECTTYDKLKCYTAQDVHDVLRNSGVESKYLARYKSISGTDPADIWFQTDLNNVLRAIKAIKDGHETFNGNDNNAPKKTIRFRPEQEKAIAETVKHFNTKKGFECLWNAKMRFGKTLSALEVARRMNYESILIVTHRPVVDQGWKDDFQKIFGGNNLYKYAERNLDDNNTAKFSLADFKYFTNLVKNGKKRLVFFVSLQYLRLSTLVGGKNDSPLKKAIMQYDWKMVIVDEAHEGTESVMGSRVLKLLNKEGSTHILSLSGTPFNLLDKFEEDKDKSKIYTWDYVMEQTAKNEWDDQHFGDPNPYAVLPKMQIMTFTLSNLLRDQVQGKGKFSFKEFFRVWTGDPKIDRKIISDEQKDHFVHEDAVKAFIKKLREKSDTTAYPFSTKEFRHNFRHTFWMLPGVKEAAALEKLLKEDKVFGKDVDGEKKFEIVNVAGDGNIEDVGGEALKAVKDAIKHNKRTITLSCGKLTTGVTVPEWTAVLCMKGSEDTAAGGYMQTIFRVQSHAVIDGRQKENCYVFDFAPDRALTAVAAASKYATIAAGDGKTNLKESRKKEEEHLTQFLKLCNVISMDGATMGRHFTATKLFEKLNTVYIEKAVKSGYADNSLYDPEVLMNLNDEQKKALGDVHGLLGSMPNIWKPDKIDVSKSGMSDDDNKKADNAEKKKRDKQPLTPEEQAALKAREEEKKEERARESVLRGVAIRIPLMVYGAEINDDEEEITIDNFTDLVDDPSWAEYMPKGFSKELFNILRTCFDRTVFTGAAKRIRSMVKEADDLDIEDRIDKIASIFACFHNPDKETVLTPWRVVNMQLSDTLGGYCFFNDKFDGPNYETDPVTHEDKKVPRLVLRPDSGDDKGCVTQDVFGDYNTRIMEINSKTGLYPLYCAYSVFKTIKEKAYIGNGLTTERKGDSVSEDLYNRYANEDKAIWEDVLQDNIFVVCRTPMAVSITKRTLAGFMNDIHMNVKCYTKRLSVDALAKAHIIKDKTPYTSKGMATKECDLIDVLRLNPDIFKNEIVKGRDFWHVYNAISLAPNEDINNMKFKAIVGNPPYQVMDGGAQASAMPVYNKFVEVSKLIKPRYFSLIMPARWYAGGRGLDDFRKDMLTDHRLRILCDYINGRDIFSNVEIKGGVCYLLWDLNWNDKCEVITHEMDSVMPLFANRFLQENAHDDVFIRDSRLLSIKNKVEKKRKELHEGTFDTIVSSMKPYGLRGDFFKDPHKYGLPPISDTPIANGIVIYGLGEKQHRVKKFVPSNYPIPNRDGIDSYKIFVPRNYGSDKLQDSVFTTYLAGPDEICTETFVQVYPFKTKEERDNCNKYMSTKFFRCVAAIRKQDQGAGKDVYAYVPLLNFKDSSDIDWSKSVAEIDQQLYNKYGLSENEINFIERMIKPM